MNKVFGYTGLGVGGSLGVAYVLPLLVDFSGTTFVAGIALTFGSIFGIAMESKKMTKTENYKGENYLVKYSEHPPLKIAGYIGLVAGMGIMISPLTTMCLIIDPMIIPKALVATSAVTGGAMWYTYNQPPNKLKSWGAPLYGTLFGFAGMGLLSVGSALIMGPNSFFDFWHQIDTYVGIPLFTGLVAYDTHVAIEDYKTDADEINSATS
jgi:FtsH-binding integral membrane protein